MPFETCLLSDLAEIIVGFPFKSDDFNTDMKGVKLVRGVNVTTGSFRWDGDSRWWSNLTPELNSYYLKKDDIIIGMDGSRVGKNYAMVQESDLPLLLVQRVACIRAKDGIDQNYLWSCISSSKFEAYIDSIKTGTTIPHISAKQIGDFPIPIVNSSIQSAVGYYSRTINHKIQIIQKINDNLSKQLECRYYNLYDSFGVNPVETMSGEYPDGWHLESVKDYCIDMKNGATPSRSKEEFWIDGEIPWVVTGEVNNSIILDTAERITESGLNNSSAKILPVDSVVMAMYGRGTAARLAYLKIEATTNQACCGMICSSPNRSAFLYETLRQMQDQVDSLASGSVQQNLSKEIIGNLKFVCPPDDMIEKMNFIQTIDSMTVNKKQMMKLARIRDCLLPKLVSGEIDVSTLELPTKYSFGRLLGNVLLMGVLYILLIYHGIVERCIDPNVP